MTDRRAFLSRLASLPLIGGSVSLIGNRSASAVPVTPILLDAYDTWLSYERVHLRWERHGKPDLEAQRWQSGWYSEAETHLFDCMSSEKRTGRFGRSVHTGAASRAAVILSAAGVPVGGGALG